ncbi:MAG: hypothetical protein KJ768_10675 [Acidobacteria bacterium]|nr:hypothetical protein [Acidobacteriota bacterium]
MAEPLKDRFFTQNSLQKFATTIKDAYPAFDADKFISLIHDEEWAGKEIMQRMRHTTESLQKMLPPSYPEALDILKKAAPNVKGFESVTLPDYVSLYGLNDWDLSLPALGYFTRFSTSELAVRPFLEEIPTGSCLIC